MIFMRIGYDAKRVFHNFRGLGNYGRILLEGLWSYYPDLEYFLFSPRIKDARAQSWHEKNACHYKLIRPRSLSFLPLIEKLYSSAWRSLFLSSVIKNYKLDIYHGISHEIPPGIQRATARSVVTIHDVLPLRHPEYFPWLDRQGYCMKLKHSVQAADMVLAVCEQSKADILYFMDCPEDKIKVSYQSCFPSFYEKETPERLEQIKDELKLQSPYILFVGALEARKNVLTLLRAFHRVSKEIPHHLLIIGSGGAYRHLLTKEIEAKQLHKRVRIISFINQADLPAVYQGADLFVYPSLYEGWGIPNVEALFSAVPVITGNSGALRESAGNHSYFIEARSLDDLSKAMKKVLLDRVLRKKMIAKGQIHAQKFHWKNTSLALMKNYRQLL